MEESFLDTTADMQTALTNIEADASLLKAAVKLRYKYPTLVQSKLFELSQDKKHIVIKSKARSGKTSGALLVTLHKMIQGIKKSKKRPHFAVVLCPNKAVCNANETLLEKAINFAKEEHSISYLNLAKASYEIFENEMFLEAKKRLIIIGTPVLFKKMLQAVPNADHFHQHIDTFFLDELNFMFSFGYEADLNEVFAHYKERTTDMNLIFSLSNEDERIKELKALTMKDSVTIKFNEQSVAEGGFDVPDLSLYNEFFYIADDLTKYIALYVLFKMKLIAGRTLILCQDLDEAYKVNCFLERCQIKTSKVYSPEWPAKVRQYFMTVFNTNLINILVSTTEVLESGKQTVSNKNGMKEVDNIISMELSNVADIYDTLSDYLTSKKSIPCLIEFLGHSEDNKELLFSLLEQNKTRSKSNTIQELPIKTESIKTFTYRCTDIYRGITIKQINTLKTMDIKRQILKSKELKEYFDEHRKERELIVKDIDKMAKKVSTHAIQMESNIPSYLLLDEEVKADEAEEGKPQKKQILKLKYNEEYEASLAKRMAGNKLTLDDVKKKRKMMGDKYMTIDTAHDDPTVTDASRLAPLSNKKLWKIRHRKSLRKVNKRLERKGIFQS